MIFDRIENWDVYFRGNNAWKRIREFIREPSPALPAGKRQIDGNDIFAVFSEYTTKPLRDGRFEAHREYIDIQILSEGTEYIYFAPCSELEDPGEYNAENDCRMFGDAATDSGRALLKEGVFSVFFPEDAHMPGQVVKTPAKVNKTVIKVRAELL
jgi:YhcH/YjgK/YiaL family protein